MSGINMFGIFQRDSKKVRYLENGVEKISELPRRKRRRNFDFIVGEVPKGNRPWDF